MDQNHRGEIKFWGFFLIKKALVCDKIPVNSPASHGRLSQNGLKI